MNNLDIAAKRAEEQGYGQLGVVCPPSLPPYTYTMDFIDMLVASGVDILFIPFMAPQVRMPWMMGGTEQSVDVVGYREGITSDMAFDIVEKTREKYPDKPIVIVSFFNDVLCYGVGRFAEKCREYGVDGIDTPGYSLITNQDYVGYGALLAAANTYLIHPISTELAMAGEGTKEYELLVDLVKAGGGFVFIMADSAGKSGATGSLPVDKLRPAVARVKALQKQMDAVCPVITVCGVASPKNGEEAVRESGSDGVLMASAVIRMIQAGESLESIGAYLHEIKRAMKK
jgi:tryptophan synthase alpha chain